MESFCQALLSSEFTLYRPSVIGKYENRTDAALCFTEAVLSSQWFVSVFSAGFLQLLIARYRPDSDMTELSGVYSPPV